MQLGCPNTVFETSLFLFISITTFDYIYSNIYSQPGFIEQGQLAEAFICHDALCALCF